MKVYLTQDPSITQKGQLIKASMFKGGAREKEQLIKASTLNCNTHSTTKISAQSKDSMHLMGYRDRSLNLQGHVSNSETKTIVPAKNNNVIKKPAEISFSGLSAVQKPVGKLMGKFLEMASDSQAVFSAFFAVGLTCLLRPAAIMSLPGKKNKDDKKYASAHSIASGLIGYGISVVAFSPISKALKTIAKNHSKYLQKGTDYILKDGKLGAKEWKALSTMLNMLPEAILALPRAILTVALIPPILKYVFGLEKKSSHSKDLHPVLDNYAAINFKSSKSKEKFQSFMGGHK